MSCPGSKLKTKIVEEKLEEMKDSDPEISKKWHENVQKMIYEMCELPLLSPMSSEGKFDIRVLRF